MGGNLCDDVDAFSTALIEPRGIKRIVADNDHRHAFGNRFQVCPQPSVMSLARLRSQVAQFGHELYEMHAAVIPRIVRWADAQLEIDRRARIVTIPVMAAKAIVHVDFRIAPDAIVHVPFIVRSVHRQIARRYQKRRITGGRRDLRVVFGDRDHLAGLRELTVAGRDEAEFFASRAGIVDETEVRKILRFRSVESDAKHWPRCWFKARRPCCHDEPTMWLVRHLEHELKRTILVCMKDALAIGHQHLRQSLFVLVEALISIVIAKDSSCDADRPGNRSSERRLRSPRKITRCSDEFLVVVATQQLRRRMDIQRSVFRGRR